MYTAHELISACQHSLTSDNVEHASDSHERDLTMPDAEKADNSCTGQAHEAHDAARGR